MEKGSLDRVRRLAVLALLLAPAPCLAMYGEQPDLAPKTYVSPSGETTLFVDPSQRSGAGEARYELRKGGAVVWSGARPFTLWDASVADDGTVGGYGYSLGYDRPVAPAGDFLVVILGPSGEERFVERTPRESSLVMHSMAVPNATGHFLDPANDRLVVRVWDPDPDAGRESWWTYRLGAGEPLGRASPKKLMTREERPDFGVVAASPVAGTPLTLVHWWRHDVGEGTNASATGARFTLVDLAYAPAWTLDLPRDYEVPGDEEAESELQRWIFEHGAILETRQPRRFEIRHAAAGQRVSYAIEREERSTGSWTVREVARLPYADPDPEPAQPAGALVFPEVTLRNLGSIPLGGEAAPSEGSPIRDISEFASDDQGRFGILRCDGCGGAAGAALVIVDAEEALVQSVALPALPEGRSFARRLAWIGGERWLVTTSEYGTKTKASAVWVDARSGAATPVAGFDCPQIEALAATRDGGFVALTTSRTGYTIDDELYAFDAQGRRRWRVESAYEDETKLFSPEDVTVATTGEVVVLENVTNQLKVYGPDGVYRHSVDLEEAWGRSPNYLSEIAADAEGGVVILDLDGESPVVRTKRDGTVLAEITPTFSGQRAFDLRGRVQAGPDGRLWASDGHALLRLDDHGVVDRVLGERPDPEALGTVAAMRVDTKGRIYAADRRTAAVHVFDSDGRRVRVFRPAAGDYHAELVLPSLAVSDAGDVLITRRDILSDRAVDFLHYSPSRGRVGVTSLALDEVSQDWHWQPATGNRWVLGYENVFLVGADGEALRVIERTTQGDWLERPDAAGVAPDGRIAVVSEALPRPIEESDGPRVVTIFSREGDALATWPAPDGLLTWADVAFDGGRFAALVRARAAAGDPEPPIAVAVLDAQGKPLFRFEPPAAGEAMRVFLVPRAGASELWLFDGRASIDRYALP